MASEVGNWEWVRELGRATVPPVGGDFLTRTLDAWLKIGQILLRSQVAQARAREPLAVVLNRVERDELREFVAEDAVTIGEALLHAGMRRDFAEIKGLQPQWRSLQAVVDALGTDDNDPGPTYAIRGPVAEIVPTLDRWCDRVDGAMRDQRLGPFADDRPLGKRTQREINAALETRFRLSNLSTTLMEATRA